MSSTQNTTPAPADPTAQPLKPMERSLLDAFMGLSDESCASFLRIAQAFVERNQEQVEQPTPQAQPTKKNEPRRSLPALYCMALSIITNLATVQLLSYEAIYNDSGNFEYAITKIVEGIEKVFPDLDFTEVQQEYKAARFAKYRR